ncbi:MAG: hypothetical protein GY747_11665 [Planctomycetes bacterium]|nr:hypothetical protein [Planctomycetota bacterium]MCP4772561.1 hypothetical protein [Planctomycetota bacterium]MCP4860871.1 hypothetical protein [Planctomycetota bacterium]
MLSTLVSICAFLSPGAVAQEPALPHPSLPVRDNEGEVYLNDNVSGYGRWIALNPGWIERGTDTAAGSRLSLLSRVAAAEGVGEETQQTWASATAPTPVVLNYRILASGKEVLAGRESAPLGKAIALSDSRRLSEILDFNVEIASGAGILDPVVGHQHRGTSLALELQPIPGMGWQAEFALVHSTTAPGVPLQDGYAQMDGKMRLIEHIAECGLTTVVKPNKVMQVELANLGPGKVVMEFSIESAPPAGVMVLAEDLAMVAVPTLASTPSWSNYLNTWEDDSNLWSNSEGFVIFQGDNALTTANVAAAAAIAQAKPFGLALTVQTIEDGVEGDVSQLSWQGLQNHPIIFAQGTVRDALTDWDVEVASVSRVADPYFENLFSGAQGEFTGRRRADGKIEVDLDIEFSVVDLLESRQIRLAAATSGEVGYDGKVPASPAQDLAIETPEVAELKFQGTYLADEKGRIVLIRSATSLLGEATRLRLVLNMTAE